MRAAAARGPVGAEPAASQIFSEDEGHEGLCPTSSRALFLIALGTILRAMGGAVGGIGIERPTGSRSLKSGTVRVCSREWVSLGCK